MRTVAASRFGSGRVPMKSLPIPSSGFSQGLPYVPPAMASVPSVLALCPLNAKLQAQCSLCPAALAPVVLGHVADARVSATSRTVGWPSKNQSTSQGTFRACVRRHVLRFGDLHSPVLCALARAIWTPPRTIQDFFAAAFVALAYPPVYVAFEWCSTTASSLCLKHDSQPGLPEPRGRSDRPPMTGLPPAFRQRTDSCGVDVWHCHRRLHRHKAGLQVECRHVRSSRHCSNAGLKRAG